MPYDLELPPGLENQGWKVKIRDKETTESPHASVLFKGKLWRIGLRDMKFLDRIPPPRGVPEDLLEHIWEHLTELCQQWDAMYPFNPVGENTDE